MIDGSQFTQLEPAALARETVAFRQALKELEALVASRAELGRADIASLSTDLDALCAILSRVGISAKERLKH